MFKKLINWIRGFKKIEMLTPGITVFEIPTRRSDLYVDLVDHLKNGLDLYMPDYRYRHFTDLIVRDQVYNDTKFDGDILVIDVTHFNKAFEDKWKVAVDTGLCQDYMDKFLLSNQFYSRGVICVFIVESNGVSALRDYNLLFSVMDVARNVLLYDEDRKGYVVKKCRATGRWNDKKICLKQLITGARYNLVTVR